MGTWYEVVAGDCIESIALAHGFFPPSVWDHPENEPLRAARENPHVLVPGDRIFIPDKQEKSVDAPTGRRHRFRRKGVPAKIRVRLEMEGEPRANVPYTLVIDGDDTVTGESDEDGIIERYISPAARVAEIRIGRREVYRIELGHLLPATDPRGARERLKNLGYHVPAPSPDADLREAVRTFQIDHDLEPTGLLDDTTRARLCDAHGS